MNAKAIQPYQVILKGNLENSDDHIHLWCGADVSIDVHSHHQGQAFICFHKDSADYVLGSALARLDASKADLSLILGEGEEVCSNISKLQALLARAEKEGF